MRYEIGNKVQTTKYGIGVIVNILEMRNYVTCYEILLDDSNKKVAVFWPEIIKKL